MMAGDGQGSRQRARKYSDAQNTTQDASWKINTTGRKRQRGKRTKAKIGAQRTTVLDTSPEQGVQGSYISKFKEVLEDSEDPEISSDDEGLTESKDSWPTNTPQTLTAQCQIPKSGEVFALRENQVPSSQKPPINGPHSTYAKIARDSHGKEKYVDTANVTHRLVGPAPPPLRGFPNFPQSNPSSRNIPLGSGRLQNTNKLGAHRFEIPG